MSAYRLGRPAKAKGRHPNAICGLFTSELRLFESSLLMVKIEIEYTGDLHSEAVHTQSGTRLQTDAPLDNGARGESFSPTDLVATALGTCMTTTMDLYAKRNGFNIDGTKAVVVKHMTSTPVRRIERLEVVVSIPLPANHPERATLEKIALNCPVQKSLNPEMEMPVTFSWGDDL